MNCKRLLALSMAALLLILLAACGNGKKADNEAGSSTPTSGNGVTLVQRAEYDAFPASLTAEKVGSFDHKHAIPSDGGLYYRDQNDLYGIMTLDGTKDTGAVFARVYPEGPFFQFAEVLPQDDGDLDAMNCVGLIAADGTVVIPAQYAVIEVLNERYARACAVTAPTDSRNDALVFYSTNLFTLVPDEEDLLYKGVWYIYDLTTGKKVEGATGTQAYTPSAYGSCLNYITDAKERVWLNSKGEQLPSTVTPLNNGCYCLSKDGVGTVYDENGATLFTYQTDGYTPSSSEGQYIVCSKYSSEGTTYTVMDLTGKQISGEFTDRPWFYGSLMLVDGNLCDPTGKVVAQGPFERAYTDDLTGCAWLLENEAKEYTLVLKDGTVVCQDATEDTLRIATYELGLAQPQESGQPALYLCVKDGGFTCPGSQVGPWLVETREGELIDLISGQVLLSGYTDYNCKALEGTGGYVYAERPDGGTDVFEIR